MSWESLQKMMDRWPELDEIQREGLLGSFRVLVASLIEYWPALTAEEKVAAIEGWLKQVDMKEQGISELSRLLETPVEATTRGQRAWQGEAAVASTCDSTRSRPPLNVSHMTRHELQLSGLMLDGDEQPYLITASTTTTGSEDPPS